MRFLDYLQKKTELDSLLPIMWKQAFQKQWAWSSLWIVPLRIKGRKIKFLPFLELDFHSQGHNCELYRQTFREIKEKIKLNLTTLILLKKEIIMTFNWRSINSLGEIYNFSFLMLQLWVKMWQAGNSHKKRVRKNLSGWKASKKKKYLCNEKLSWKLFPEECYFYM